MPSFDNGSAHPTAHPTLGGQVIDNQLPLVGKPGGASYWCWGRDILLLGVVGDVNEHGAHVLPLSLGIIWAEVLHIVHQATCLSHGNNMLDEMYPSGS